MGMNQERHFFLSGLISLSFFISLVIIVTYSSVLSPKIEQFSMIKSDVINVSLAIQEDQSNTESIEPAVSDITPSPISENIIEPLKEPKNEIVNKSPQIAVSDLFSSIKSDKQNTKAAFDAERIEKLNVLERELADTKEIQKFSDKVNTLSIVKPSVKIVSAKGSEGPIVNEYHAKIQAMVTSYWNPTKGTLGHKAVINIRISPSGKLIGYKVLRYSGNGLFNSDVDRFEDYLYSLTFPAHPEKREANLNLDLMAI